MASEKEKRIAYERQRRREERKRDIEQKRWIITDKRRGEMHQADLRAKRLKNKQAQLAYDRAEAAERKRYQAEKKKAGAAVKAKVMKPKPKVAPIPPKKPKPPHVYSPRAKMDTGVRKRRHTIATMQPPKVIRKSDPEDLKSDIAAGYRKGGLVKGYKHGGMVKGITSDMYSANPSYYVMSGKLKV